MQQDSGVIRIGISGWTYPPWRGRFYPPGLVQRTELAYVAERLNSVEINGSFYALQRPTSYRAWRAQVGEDFVFSVKGGRFITHMKKLSEVETPLANFFASGVLALGPTLGPILWQLPPNLGFNADRMSAFFDLLPRTAGAAAQLAAQHDAKIGSGRELISTEVPAQPIRHTVEVRHHTFCCDDFYALLRVHDIGLVVADNPGQWPILEQLTSDFMYVRLHGNQELYASGYSDDALRSWADKIRGWSDAGQDIFVYCNNDAKVHAPYDAIRLRQLLED